MKRALAIVGLLGCAASVTPPPSESPRPAPAAASSGAPSAGPTAAPSAAPAAPQPAEAPPVQVLSFERVRQAPVRSVALGKDGRVAVLEDEPALFDGKAWQPIPLPAALRAPAGASDEAHIFFGRDNRPRMMGTRTSAEGRSAIYLRYKNGWRTEPKEIGQLAWPPHEGLFGVLGHDDPEVVCRIGDICILKRLTGWTIIKAGAEAAQVVVTQSSAWALYPDRIAQVSNDGWKALAPLPFTGPRGLWASAGGTLWVSAPDGLYRHDAAGWRKEEAPDAGVVGLWGSSESDVWAAGAGGALHFDGQRWRRVAGVDGPVALVAGSGAADVWLAGSSGLWHGTRP